MRRKGKTKGDKSEGEMTHERLWTPGNHLRVLEGRGVVGEWVSPVVGIKKGTDHMEHWVLYASNESWNITSKTNDGVYIW